MKTASKSFVAKTLPSTAPFKGKRLTPGDLNRGTETVIRLGVNAQKALSQQSKKLGLK
jgi:hypothetical protein